MSQDLTMGEIRSRVQTYLLNTSTDTSSLSWSATEINGYINEGVFYTQQLTQWREQWDNILCTASVSTYTAPDRVYQFKRVTWDRTFLPQTNEYELDRDDLGWRQAGVNNPFRFYFPQMGTSYQIRPYPTPKDNGVSYSFSSELGLIIEAHDSSAGDGSFTFSSEFGVVIQGPLEQNHAIVVYNPDTLGDPFGDGELGVVASYLDDTQNLGIAFVAMPDVMTDDAHIPQLPSQCHPAIVFYALAQCFDREGEFQDKELAKGWFDAYADWMNAVLENKARWWATRVKSLEPYEEGSIFAQRLNAIGAPFQLELKPSY